MSIISNVFSNGSTGQYSITFLFDEGSTCFLRTFAYTADEATQTEKVSIQDMLDEIPMLVVQDVYLELEQIAERERAERDSFFRAIIQTSWNGNDFSYFGVRFDLKGEFDTFMRNAAESSANTHVYNTEEEYSEAFDSYQEREKAGYWK